MEEPTSACGLNEACAYVGSRLAINLPRTRENMRAPCAPSGAVRFAPVGAGGDTIYVLASLLPLLSVGNNSHITSSGNRTDVDACACITRQRTNVDGLAGNTAVMYLSVRRLWCAVIRSSLFLPSTFGVIVFVPSLDVVNRGWTLYLGQTCDGGRDFMCRAVFLLSRRAHGKLK